MYNLANGDEKLKDFFREYLHGVSLRYVVDCVRIFSLIDDLPIVEESLCLDDFIGLYDVLRDECFRRLVLMVDLDV